MSKKKLVGIAVACIIGILVVLAIAIPSEPTSTPYIYENGAIAVGADGEPIELINNPNATNPTYAELIAFIVTDSTDTKDYFKLGPIGYVCADFAEDVHNNAEAAGIRAAWVSIDFGRDDEGHACNAFETTDRGLVYIDCTGGSYLRNLLDDYREFKLGHAPKSKPTSWDTVAYVEIGKEYGLIDIAKAKSLTYSFYEECKQKWQEYEKLVSDYNDEVMRYNQEIGGKVYHEGSPELARIEAWGARLEEKGEVIDELSEELGDFWVESLGIVKDIHIHW